MHHLSLVKSQNLWRICHKVQGRDPTRWAWVSAETGKFFCEVGRECQCYTLPEFTAPQTDFFGDQFNYTIETVNSAGKKIDRLAGAENVLVARVAYDFLVNHGNSFNTYRLKQGARILELNVGAASSRTKSTD